MADYYFTQVEVRLNNGDIIKGQWISAAASYITLKAEDGTVFYIPFSSILYLKMVEVKE